MCKGHKVQEVSVDKTEFSELVRKLSLYVLISYEDGLEVNPLSLNVQP